MDLKALLASYEALKAIRPKRICIAMGGHVHAEEDERGILHLSRTMYDKLKACAEEAQALCGTSGTCGTLTHFKGIELMIDPAYPRLNPQFVHSSDK